MVIENGGNVGIGTATPDDLLDISKANLGASASDVFLTITNASTTGTADVYLDFEIGEDTTIWRLGVDDSDGDKFRIAQGAAFNATSSGLTINLAGNVGIGTTNPSVALDITGALTVSGAVTFTTALTVAQGGTGATTLSSGDLLVGAGTGVITSTSTLAANRPSSGDQAMEIHAFASAAALAVQVMPSGEVMTLFVPGLDTAANRPSSGDQAMDRQLFASADALAVQVMPSGLVMTPFALLSADTAANRPSSGDQATETHPFASDADLAVQVVTASIATVEAPQVVSDTSHKRSSPQ